MAHSEPAKADGVGVVGAEGSSSSEQRSLNWVSIRSAKDGEFERVMVLRVCPTLVVVVVSTVVAEVDGWKTVVGGCGTPVDEV